MRFPVFHVSSRTGLSWEEYANNWNQLDITGEHSKMEKEKTREKIGHAASSCKRDGNN